MRTRKPNRLEGYDYSQDGAYFVTVCTINRAHLFGRVVAGSPTQTPVMAVTPGQQSESSITCNNAAKHSTAVVLLSELGKCLDEAIRFTNDNNRHGIKILNYVVMPNHVHMIIYFPSNTGSRQRPALQKVVGKIKAYVSRQAGFPVWQKSFHDRIIRDSYAYYQIAKYIDENPAKWVRDVFNAKCPMKR